MIIYKKLISGLLCKPSKVMLEPDIKLKKCFEEDGEISFLDIKFSKNNGVSVYRKPTHTDVYINYKSNYFAFMLWL